MRPERTVQPGTKRRVRDIEHDIRSERRTGGTWHYTSSGQRRRRGVPLDRRRRSCAPRWPGGAAVAAGGLLDACGPAPPVPGLRPRPGRRPTVVAPSTGGNLKVGLTGGGSSDTLNPFYGGISAIGTARAQQLYQPLVQLSNEAQLQYVLAEEIAPKGSTANWVIQLRPGVTFHNGKPFGADDVIYTLRTILNPKEPLGRGDGAQPGGHQGDEEVGRT